MTAFIVEHPFIFVIFVISLIAVVLHYINKNSSRAQELDIREENLEKRSAAIWEKEKNAIDLTRMQDEVNQKLSTLRSTELVLDSREVAINQRENNLNETVRQKVAATVLDLTKRDYLSSTKVFSVLRKSPDEARLSSALSQDMRILPPFDMSAQIHSESGNFYKVTLNSCTCMDFKQHSQPCKHMYRLAAELGALLAYDTKLQEEKFLDLKKQRDETLRELKRSERDAKRHIEMAAKDLSAVKQLVEENSQSYPWLADLYAEYFDTIAATTESRLRNKRPPAKKAADDVRNMRLELKTLARRCKIAEHQLRFYENMFPWLEEFKELSPQDAYNATVSAFDVSASSEEYTSLKSWLSPEEYQALPSAQKYQLALERYTKRKKTNWEIGIEFERYIGYEFELLGYKVKYQGALLGLEDMGRDLIATKGNKVYVVQCKRWAQEKAIHEKHIFQLYGSLVLLATENPSKDYIGALVTSATLSDVARRCAVYLGIQVYEKCPLREYPLIKCNIGKSGERIYHLPFDQQYDKVDISSKDGAYYVKTVEEAEKMGFRRAFRWSGHQ